MNYHHHDFLTGQFCAFAGSTRMLCEARFRVDYCVDDVLHKPELSIERLAIEWTWDVINCLAMGRDEDCLFTARIDGSVFPHELNIPLESHNVSGGYLTIDSPGMAEWFASYYLEDDAA